MEPTTNEGQAPKTGSDDGQYEKVEGLDRKSIETQRMLEQVAADKTASDYEHIVWAYGVIWALFCAYGLWLYRRSVRLDDDITALSRKLDRAK